MTEQQYRRQWLKWHKGYETIVYRKLMKYFRNINIPFDVLTVENYTTLINPKEDELLKVYVDFYKEVGIIHAKRVDKDIKKQTKDFTSFLSEFERTIITWLYENSLTRIRSVSGDYVDYIRQIITKGIEENKTISEITTELKKLLTSRNFYRYQAMRIARTETTAAANHASIVVSETSNLVYDKVWISSNDARTRRIPKAKFDHASMNMVKVPVKEFFNVPSKLGSERLLFAGDPKGSAGNVINCRCANVLRPRRDADGRLVRKIV